MSLSRYLLIFLAVGLTLPFVPVKGVEPKGSELVPAASSHKLKVAVFDRPPYTFKTKEGLWSGIGIELWEQIAEELHLPYEYVEVPLSDIYTKLHSGECDLAPTLTLVPKGIGQVDYTASYLFSYAAVQTVGKSLISQTRDLCENLSNRGFFVILLIMAGIVIIYGFVILLIERRKDFGHLSGPHHKRFFHALWFSALSFTTPDYAETLELSPIGTIGTYIWSLMGIAFLALFSGTLITAISESDNAPKTFQVEDLTRYKVGTLKGSAFDSMLRERGLPVKEFPSPEDGLDALAKGQISAFAGDAIPMTYIATNRYPGKFVLSIVRSKPLFYTMAVRQGLPQFQEINKKILEISLAPDWERRMEHWTGPLSF